MTLYCDTASTDRSIEEVLKKAGRVIFVTEKPLLVSWVD
jgi:hypothetical protein